MWGEEQWLAGFWMVYPMVKSAQLPWLGSLRFGHPRLFPVWETEEQILKRGRGGL